MVYELSAVKLELIDRTKCYGQNKVFFLIGCNNFCRNLPFKQIVKYSIITVKHGIEYLSHPS